MTTKTTPLIGPPNQRSTGTGDRRFVNALLEFIIDSASKSLDAYCTKRPGLANSTQPPAGAATGRGVYAWGANSKIYSVFANKIYSGTTDLMVTLAGSSGRVWWQETPAGAATRVLIVSDGADTYQIQTDDTITQIDENDDAQFPTTNLGSMALLDGFLFLAQSDGDVWNTDVNNYSSWGASSFLRTNRHGDNLEAIHLIRDQVLAFGKNSIEFYFNAGNAAGSPLTRIEQNALDFGLAAKETLAWSGATTCFVGENASRGDGERSVWMIAGLSSIKEISTPSMNRFLKAEGSSISSATAWMERIAGQLVYVLNLSSANRTFVFNLDNNTRTEWETATKYLSLPGSSGNYASTPDSVANSITGDIDIRVKVAMTDWTPTATNQLVTKWNGSGNQRSYILEIQTNGRPRFFHSADGSASAGDSATAAPVVSDGNELWIRVTADVDDGAGNHVVKFYTSADGQSWTQLGSTVTTAGTISLFDSIAPVEIGTLNAGVTQPLSGKVYYAEIRNGIDGTVVAKFDATTFVVGETSAVATTGETWTINQSGSPEAEILAGKFNGIAATSLNGTVYVQDAANGRIYTMLPTTFQDSGSNFTVTMQTTRLTHGTDNRKFIEWFEAIGDTTTGNLAVSYSDDDFATFSTARNIDLSQPGKRLTRMGSYRQRAYKATYTDNYALRLQAFREKFTEGSH